MVSLLDAAALGHPCRAREWDETETRSNNPAETRMGNRSISNRLWRLADRETRAARLDLAGVVAQFQRIELKSQSKSPVSQGVARSGKTQWHPYCSQTLINATNVEPRISWLPPSCTNREHGPFPAYSMRGQANPIQHKPLRRRILADIYDPCYYGEFQYVLLSFGPSSVSLAFSIVLNPLYHWETRSLFCCFSESRALVGCS